MGTNEVSGGFFPRRILMVQLRQVGDAIMCTPAIRALRRACPESRIDFLAEGPAAGAVARNPYLDHIIVSEAHSSSETLRTISRIRGNRYDLVVDYLANPTSALISVLSGATVTLSYGGKRRSRFYTHTVVPQGQYSAAHKLSLLKTLGIVERTANIGLMRDGGHLKPDFFVSKEAYERVGGWLRRIGIASGERFVVIDPTHRRITRRYTRYAEVARMVKDKLGFRCVFVWGPGEEEEVRFISMQAGEGHVMAPRTDLDELGALTSCAALLVGNDSAPRHIAAALSVPTVIVVGSTRPENWTLPSPIHRTVSLDIECRPCEKNVCPLDHLDCMTKLDPEKILSEITDVLEKHHF